MIDERDLQIEIYRNAAVLGTVLDVAVRVTHLPTGVQAVGEDPHSSRIAKEAAMRGLSAKLEAGGHGGEDHPDDVGPAAL